MIQAYFDVIAGARRTVQTIPESRASDACKAAYLRSAKVLLTRGGTVAKLIAAVGDTTKVATWFARKAAVMHSTRSMVVELLLKQDRLQRGQDRAALVDERGEDWRKTVDKLQRAVSLLEAMHAAKPITIEDRRNRKSKRAALKGLPVDWRERLIQRMPSCTLPALVAAVTGCRPAELVTGVKLTIERGELVALIAGAKVTAKSGQEWRRLYWPVETESPLVKSLIAMVREKQVYDGVTIQIENAKAFSGTMRAAGNREWGNRKEAITPYCFRHQAAADMKACGGLSSGDISAALGHCRDITKTTYGHAGMGGKGGVAPSRVLAAKTVTVKVPSARARKKTAQLKGSTAGVFRPP